MKNIRIKQGAAALILSLLLLSGSAGAGFLEDFYANAGLSQGNITRAGIYQSAAANAITGGGFVYKAPVKSFTPFSFSAPKITSGCAGIDIFLGAFSIPSREEFVAFLRSIGTALPGLAFQLALQTFAPDLNEQVTSFRELIREYTEKFSSACAASQALLDMTGAKEFMEDLKYRASNHLRASGASSDAAAAQSAITGDPEKLFSGTPEQTDSSGAKVLAPEMNLTWALLSGGEFSAYPKSLKEVMMTLTGTVIYRKAGEGKDATVSSTFIPGADIAGELFESDPGSVRVSGVNILSCGASDAACLAPAYQNADDINLTRRILTAAKNYRESILTRAPSKTSAEDLAFLATASTVPLLRIVSVTSTARFPGLTESVLAAYAEAASYEAILRAVMGLTRDIEKAVTGSSASGASKISADHAQKIAVRLAEIRADLDARSDRVFQQMNRANTFVTQLEHLESAIYGNAAKALAAQVNLKGSAR